MRRKRRNKNKEINKETVSWIMHITFPIFLAFMVVFCVGMRISVIGVSMEDTLYNEQQILVNRLSYLFFQPDKGDIVVFKLNGNRNIHYYVKRVVAVPGDSVQIKDGKLYVNNEETEFEYDKIMDYGIAENELILENGEYFVMGDNCNNSEDSRSDNIGPIRKDMLEGKVWFQLGREGKAAGFIH